MAMTAAPARAIRREVKSSFWFPTWLAQAAAMVAGIQADRRAAAQASSSRTSRTDVKAHDLIVIHTSDPVLPFRLQDRRADQGANPTPKIGFIGAKVAVEPEESLQALPAIDFVARNEYDFTIQELADGNDWATSRVFPIATRTARSSTTRNAKSSMDMDKLPSVLPIYKRAQDREIFRRLSQAPLHVLVHRPRLQIALHILPVAADDRRAQLPHRSIPHVIEEVKYPQKEFPAGEGNLLRRRHADRRPARARSAGQGTRQARRRVVVQRQGECAAQDAGSDEGQRPSPAARRL